VSPEPDRAIDLPELAAGDWSPATSREASCPKGDVAFGDVDVQGVCRHPGFFDGDDHAFGDESRLEASRAGACGGSFKWSHRHDGQNRAARAWLKAYSAPSGGGLVSLLPAR
jgi:hypothetical protein